MQLLRAVRQLTLDQGFWDVVGLLLPKQDPLDRVRFGKSAAEFEIVVAYRDAMKKIQKGAKDQDDEQGSKKDKGDDGQ